MTRPKDPSGCFFISLCLITVGFFLVFVGNQMMAFVALIGFLFKGWGL